MDKKSILVLIVLLTLMLLLFGCAEKLKAAKGLKKKAIDTVDNTPEGKITNKLSEAFNNAPKCTPEEFKLKASLLASAASETGLELPQSDEEVTKYLDMALSCKPEYVQKVFKAKGAGKYEVRYSFKIASTCTDPNLQSFVVDNFLVIEVDTKTGTSVVKSGKFNEESLAELPSLEAALGLAGNCTAPLMIASGLLANAVGENEAVVDESLPEVSEEATEEDEAALEEQVEQTEENPTVEQPQEEPQEEPKEQPKEEPQEEPKEQPKEEPQEEPKEQPKEEKSGSACAIGEPTFECFKTCGLKGGECREVSIGCSVCDVCKEGELTFDCDIECVAKGGECREVSQNPDCSVCEFCEVGESAVDCFKTCGAKGGYCDQVSTSPDCYICDTCQIGEPKTICAETCPAKGGRCEEITERCALCAICDFPGFVECRDSTFDLQGCIDVCPMVDVACPSGTPPNTDCKETDQSCVDVCWDKGTEVGQQCASENYCTPAEIESKLR